MQLDERGLALEADKFYRSLSHEQKQRVHPDDVLAVIRRHHVEGISTGKATKGTTILIACACLALGFLVGSTISPLAAWILGAIGGFGGFKLGEALAAHKVQKQVSENLTRDLEQLISTHR